MAALPPLLTRRDCLVAGGLLLGGGAPPGRAAEASRSAASAAAAPSPAAAPAAAPPADLPVADPAFNTRLIGRLQGDLSGRQRWIYNPGFVFATVPGRGLAPAEFGRLLYRVEGFTSRISRLLPDGSVEERSHSWMFYRHADEERWLEGFDNPWTGERLEVPPYRGGPSHSWLRPATGTAVDGATVGLESTGIGAPVRVSWRVLGDRVWLSRHAASRIRTPAGAVRNEFSMDAWVCGLDDLRDERRSHLPATYTWTSQAEWQPWLRMDGRPGGLLWRIESMVLDDPARLPAHFTARLQELLPGKLEERLAW
jgi:hypothetical protein